MYTPPPKLPSPTISYTYRFDCVTSIPWSYMDISYYLVHCSLPPSPPPPFPPSLPLPDSKPSTFPQCIG